MKTTLPYPRLRALVLALLLAAAAAPEVRASGDHHDAPTAAPVQVSPRGHARADNVEIVAVAAPGRRLVIYLDQLSTNEPLTGAEVGADADGFRLALRDGGDGTYIANDWFPTPGPNTLVVTYRTATVTGQANVIIDVPQVAGMTQARMAATSMRIEQANMGVVVAAAVALYLAAMALFLWRARRQRIPTL